MFFGKLLPRLHSLTTDHFPQMSGLTYKDSGVDIKTAAELVGEVADACRRESAASAGHGAQLKWTVELARLQYIAYWNDKVKELNEAYNGLPDKTGTGGIVPDFPAGAASFFAGQAVSSTAAGRAISRRDFINGVRIK
mgnify:CR=1 FL=1